MLPASVVGHGLADNSFGRYSREHLARAHLLGFGFPYYFVVVVLSSAIEP